MIKKVVFSLICCVLLSTNLIGQKIYNKIDRSKQEAWVDSIFQALSPEERLGQLFMVAAYSNRNEEHYTEIDQLISEYHIGGLIFFQGGPYRQAKLNNRYQSQSKVPLMIAMDAEWGIGMRLDSVYDFPKQMTLGAIQDNKWVYEMGKEVAHQFKTLKMHINFAPVVDVNSNPNNPVIGYRSFGADQFNVANKGVAYMKGMQDHRVMANAKHFPGHGDTDTDSHYALPVIKHDQRRINEIELYPFKQLMNDSLLSVMIAHLQIPAYDNRKNTPTTLSENIVTGLLRNELKFDGLAFTDAMNMQGVAKYYEPGEADVKALQAGNDVILFPLDVPKAIKKVKKAIKKGSLDQASIDQRVKNILRAKYWLGLDQSQMVNTNNLNQRLNNTYGLQLNRLLYQKAITVVDNSDDIIPVLDIDNRKFASLSFGAKNTAIFNNYLDKYAPFEHISLDSLTEESLDYLSHFDLVIIPYQGIKNSPRNRHGVIKNQVDFIKKLQQKTKTITVAMGNAYALQYFEGVDNIICTYEDNAIIQQLVPQIIFGAIQAEGRLPITAGENFKQGMGINTSTTARLSYGLPEEVGMSSDSLKYIDQIVEEAVKNKALPGAQVLVSRNGKVVYQKNFGHQTYDEQKPIKDETLYDLASLTKVIATTQVLMKLYDEGKIDINKSLGYYLPELKGSNKEKLVIRNVLTHQAGLKPYIPFWRNTLEDGQLKPEFFNEGIGPNHKYQIQDTDIPKALEDSLWNWTINSDLRELSKNERKYDYLYSDLGFNLLFKVIEEIINEPMESYLEREFYKPLGLNTTTFLPLENGFYHEIAPTEVDNYFRNTVVCGQVNDQNAALMGGIAGHAGLFSNSNDLAIIMQMNLNMGQYAGKRYFSDWTVPIFTTPQSMDNRRALGWDKPITATDEGPTSRYSSASTFGHTGFTGGSIWADPAEELIFIFLSNRTYPESGNLKLIQTNVRTRIHDVVYRSILEP
jgi:beta-glucosidase-like glycosyl hydrolase/CubicO group peptidase (beta-lactamase class C family)